MSTKLRAYLERKQKLTARAQEILDGVVDEGRQDLTIQEAAEHTALLAEIRRLDADIQREKALIEAERTAPALNVPAQDINPAALPRYTNPHGAPARGRRFAEMFPGASRTNGGFATFGEFLGAVRAGVMDPRIQFSAATGSSEGVGADGGALVPEYYVAQMLDESLDSEVVRPRATLFPMQSNSLWVGGFDLTNNQQAIGGFNIAWAAEGDKLTFQKAKTRAMKLVAAKAGILTAATNELLSDSGFFSQELPTLMTQAAGFGLDEAFLRGDGVGKPLGVLNDPALITVAKESGQAADTVVFNNLVKMYSRLHPTLRRGAVWVASHDLVIPLLTLVQHVYNVAGTEHVGGVPVKVMREESGRFFIFGIEVLFTEKMPVLGEAGDLLLVNFSQYAIGMRKEVSIERSGHLLFDSDETAFRLILRVDGKGRWNAPMTPRNGGDTLSWCVALGERS